MRLAYGQVGCHLESDGATVGMADEMDRSGRLIDLIAQLGDFLRQRHGQ